MWIKNALLIRGYPSLFNHMPQSMMLIVICQAGEFVKDVDSHLYTYNILFNKKFGIDSNIFFKVIFSDGFFDGF